MSSDDPIRTIDPSTRWEIPFTVSMRFKKTWWERIKEIFIKPKPLVYEVVEVTNGTTIEIEGQHD